MDLSADNLKRELRKKESSNGMKITVSDLSTLDVIVGAGTDMHSKYLSIEVSVQRSPIRH